MGNALLLAKVSDARGHGCERRRVCVGKQTLRSVAVRGIAQTYDILKTK